MVSNSVISEMKVEESDSATSQQKNKMVHGSTSRRFLPAWGNTRFSIVPTGLVILIFSLQLLENAGAYPLEERISQVAAVRAAMAAAMGSGSGGGSPHHKIYQLEQGNRNLMKEQENEEILESSMPRLEAVELLLNKAAIAAAAQTAMEEKEMEMDREEQQEEEAVEESRAANGRSLWSHDFERRASELCRTSATLQCGKRIVTLTEGQEEGLSVHMKCDLRDDFLKCIDSEKKDCLELARSSILPELPPKEMIKKEQSKLWKILWTAGGCILSN